MLAGKTLEQTEAYRPVQTFYEETNNFMMLNLQEGEMS